jgi:hypothetical protein
MKINALRRFLALSVGALLTTATTGVVLAGHPHFVGKPEAEIKDDGDLKVTFKVAGLDKKEKITAFAKAEVKATFRCVNPSGHCPPAENKTRVVEKDVRSDKEHFEADRDGKVIGRLIIEAPHAPDFCPPGHEEKLVEIEYDDITVVVEDKHGRKITKEADSVSEELFDCR